MYKKGLIILLVAILVVGFNVSTAGAGKELASEEIKVIVNIPAYQELHVIEPIEINKNSMVKAQENGESDIIKDVGKIKVRSNTSWSLHLNSLENNSNYEILIKESGDTEWQVVSSGASFTGKNGDKILKFDLKVVSKEVSTEQIENNNINFRYSLFKI